MKTALLHAFEGAGEQVAASDYHGATTIARFSDPGTEWKALRTGCGVYDLGFRTKLSLAGRDRARWLNGMITNNVRDLAPERGVYAFLLNPQGHILGDLYAYNLGESLMVDTDRGQSEKILATFKKYIIMDKVELAGVGEQLTSIGVAGPEARAILKSADIDLPDLVPLQVFKMQCDCECGCLECTIVRGDMPYESYEIWLAPQFVKPLWDGLVRRGAVPVGSETLELQRITSGIPLYGVDIRERELPQETEQTRALNFTKGCYIGQEIVERIRSRGNVHRKFTAFLIEPGALPAAGTKVIADEKEVGEMSSAASLAALGSPLNLGLGYIRREIGTPGREVSIGGVKAHVTEIPLNESVLHEHETAAAHR